MDFEPWCTLSILMLRLREKLGTELRRELGDSQTNNTTWNRRLELGIDKDINANVGDLLDGTRVGLGILS